MTTRLPHSRSRLFVLTLCAFLIAGLAHADAFHDPESVDWKFRYGLSDTEYAKAWDEYKKEGYIPIDTETDDNGKTYAGVWQKNTDGRGWASWRRLSDQDFHQKWEEYRKKGYRPIDQDAELVGGKLLYSLIMVQNKENLNWISRRNLTSAQFSAEFAQNKDKYRPIDIDAVEVNKTLYYSIIWLENKSNTGWAEFRDMTPDDYGKKFVEYKDKGYRVADLACYARNGKLTYAAIWEKNPPGRAWAALREMSATGLRNNWYKYSDQGMRVIDIEVCPAADGKGSQYAAVWRENSDRHDWSGRAKAEQILASYAADPAIPGVGAAIVRNGRVIFRGGAGYADKDKDLQAHGRTIYRLASVAKAVTGTLAYDMEQANMINLGNRTNTIVSGLGSQHTHTVRQLLSNTGCVKHYSSDGLDDNGTKVEYATAKQALDKHLSGALKTNAWIIPGCSMGTHNYSTHGYTLAAAALEARGGTSFYNLIKTRIADPLNLSTLRVEKRSGPDSSGERATINAGAGKVSASKFENVSWKSGGSGMESSALDLALFGDGVLRNRYFPLATRNILWSGGNRNGQANGWQIDSGVTLASKGGDNQGSDSHIRVDIKNGISVVVLTNTNPPPVETSSITSQLLSLAIANP